MRRALFALLLILFLPLAAQAQPVWTKGEKCRMPGGWPLQYGIENTTGLLAIFDPQNEADTSALKDGLFSTNNLDLQQITAGNQPTTPVVSGYKVWDFDGDDYLQQEEIDSEQGALSYTDESGVSTFTDAGQAFTAWQTASGNAAYCIVVHNNDATVSYGYLGAAVGATEIKVYTTKALTITGWNVTNPSGKTPSTYEVYRSDWAMTGDQTHILIVKPDDGQPAASQALLGKRDYGNNQQAISCVIADSGKLEFTLSAGTLSTGVQSTSAVYANGAQSVFSLLCFTYQGSSQTARIYKDGTLVASANRTAGGPPTSLMDTPVKFSIGAMYNNTVLANYFNGQISLYIPFSRVLTPTEITAIYNSCIVRKKLAQ